MKPINGVVTGIVTHVGAGKVKLKFPWLHEDENEERQSNWARIATAMAGSDRGTFLMPEVEDEVLVAFEKGSFDHPYVIGFLWNGRDEPPDTDTQKRVIKTRSGHTITFDDNSGSEEILIESQGGQKVTLKDTPVGSITIQTKMGNEISLDESAGGSISLNALNQITLTAPVSITLESASVLLDTQVVSMGTALSVTPASFTILSPTIQLTGTTSVTGPTSITGPSGIPVLSGGALTIS